MNAKDKPRLGARVAYAGHGVPKDAGSRKGNKVADGGLEEPCRQNEIAGKMEKNLRFFKG